MTQILYKRFLEDKNVYRLSQGYWKKQLNKLAKAYDFTLSPYLNNDQEEYDGNPIFESWVPAINRGVRIIQAEPQAEDFEPSAWFDTIEINKDQIIDELVIDLVLTRETRDVAMKLIKEWLVTNPSLETMETFINHTIASPTPPPAN